MIRHSALFAGLVLLAPALAWAQPISQRDARLLNELVEETLERYREEAREATAKGNPGPAVNLEHVERLIATADAEAQRMRLQGQSPEVARAAMAFSDLGKNPGALERFANEVFPDPEGKDKGRFFRAFLMHEVVGRELFRERAMEKGLSADTIERVERANVGHNGPAVPGTFWHRSWTAMVKNYEGTPNTDSRLGRLASHYLNKDYALPTTAEGAYHTALDRRDQGTRDGSLKIMAEAMTNQGKSLEEAFDELFRRNQSATQLQFDELRRLFPKVFEFPSVQEAERAVAETTRYANHVRFSERGTKAEVVMPDGRVVEATSYEEFKAAIEQIDKPSEKPLIEGAHDPARRLTDFRERPLPELLREARQRGIELAPGEATNREALLSKLTGLNEGEVQERLAEAPPAANSTRETARRTGASRRIEEIMGRRATGKARPKGRR